MTTQPLDLDELVEHWTLLDGDHELVAGKPGTSRLAFALMLKFYARHGRFPDSDGDLADALVEFVRARSGCRPSRCWAPSSRAAPSSTTAPRSHSRSTRASRSPTPSKPTIKRSAATPCDRGKPRGSMIPLVCRGDTSLTDDSCASTGLQGRASGSA